MTTIEIEVYCDSQEQAERLTNRIMNGDHHVGRKHGKWVWFCGCKPSEMIHLGQELFYELDDAQPPETTP